jgi:hypothetical protein
MKISAKTKVAIMVVIATMSVYITAFASGSPRG